MLVNQILFMKDSDEIVTIRPDQSVEEAAKLLAQRRIGALVVTEDGRQALGILSERDILRALGENGAVALTRQVAELMTRKLSTCRMGDDALNVLDRMTQGRFRHMPVVDEQGGMIGLISIGDAVSARLKELHAEKEALTGMIMGT